MPTAPTKTSDKMELSAYVKSVARQYLQAMRELEEEFPEWRGANVTITARGVLKPAKIGGIDTVVVDLDEPANMPISEIPIPLQRTE